MNTNQRSPLFLKKFLGLILTCQSASEEYHQAEVNLNKANAAYERACDGYSSATKEYRQAIRHGDLQQKEAKEEGCRLATQNKNQAGTARCVAMKQFNSCVRELVFAKAEVLEQEMVLDDLLNEITSQAIVFCCPICQCEQTALKALQVWRIKMHALEQATAQYQNLLPWHTAALVEPFQIEMEHAEKQWHTAFETWWVIEKA